MPDEPAREIEVEVLPPGAIPRARPESSPPRPGPNPTHGAVPLRREQSGPQIGTSEFHDPFLALLARLMDSQFVIPGTNIRFGLDPIIGLLPGIGDGATALTSLMLLLKAVQRGIPKIILARMAMNIVLNSTIGAIPVVGDAFSFWFKSNNLNYALLQQYANGTPSSTRSDWFFVVALLGGLAIVLVLTVIGYVTMLKMIVGLFSGK